MRPRTIHLYANTLHILGFDQAKDTGATQTVTLENEDWNSNGTANVGLDFRKFQNISHLVISVEEGDGTGEKTLLDRVTLISKGGVLEKAGQSTLKADPVLAEARVDEKHQQQKQEDSTPGRHDLIAELHGIPGPLQEALAPFLEDEKSRDQVEQRFRELESNTHHRQDSALGLLHALGSIEESDNEVHEGAQNTTSCGDGDLPGLTAFGNDGTNQGDASPKPPFSPEDQLSPNEDPAAVDTEAQLQTQTSAEKFFDWSSLHSRTLPAKEDILDKKHLALLSMYDPW